MQQCKNTLKVEKNIVLKINESLYYSRYKGHQVKPGDYEMINRWGKNKSIIFL